MRVLLIEDDVNIAQSIELMLKSETFNVYTTDLGEEGVDLGKLYDYDIILLDLNLPDMSGYEVLRSLRVAKVKTPILILSGLAGIEDKVRGLGFGAAGAAPDPHGDRLDDEFGLFGHGAGRRQRIGVFEQLGFDARERPDRERHRQDATRAVVARYTLDLADQRLADRELMHARGSPRTGPTWTAPLRR